ncbi:replication initiator protein [Microviridae sp.]|nr:replication initiator protein [Microviridae sp.]
MPCYHPMKAWRSLEVNPSGKRSLVFDASKGFKDLEVTLPCGQCIGCRIERSRQWAVRCVHEASLHDDNCFITLTYDNDHLPADGSLDVSHFQKFMKRLRRKFPDKRIRFFHCGEYGEKYGRPHYHALIFGFDFPDKELYQVRNDQKLFISDILSKLWPFGFSSIGSVTFDSAAYVSRYIMKKVTGDKAALHYSDIDYDTGEILGSRKPEYVTMSRKPGIAADWFREFGSDVFPDDFVVINGKKYKPPKFYDGQFELSHPDELKAIKAKRIVDAKARSFDNTPERLHVKEKVKFVQLQRLVRGLD